MLDAFWSGVGQELAKHWVARVFTPAFMFWVGGLALVWWSGHGAGMAANGWTAELTASADQVGALPVFVQVTLVVGGLVLVAASAAVAERLTTPLLRLLEGYWTRPGWLRGLLVGYRRWRHTRVRERVVPLQRRQRRGTLNVAEFAKLRELRAAPAPDPASLTGGRRRGQGADCPGGAAEEARRPRGSGPERPGDGAAGPGRAVAADHPGARRPAHADPPR